MATERRPHKRAASPRSRKTTRPIARSRTPKAPRASRVPKAPAKIPDDVSRTIAAALDKKAEHVQLLDLRKGQAFTDFFIICTGNNIRHVQAIADGIEEVLRKTGVRPALVEGYVRGEWILMDFFDFIVHVFTPATREFYGLERLWGDAERTEVSA